MSPQDPVHAADPRKAADHALVAATLAGRRHAEQELVERLGCVRAVVRFQNRRLGGRLAQADVDDIVQSTLEAVWSKLSRYDGRVAFEAWVHGFCCTAILKHLDSARRAGRVVLDPDLEAVAPGADPAEQPEHDVEIVRLGLAQLEPPGSEVVRLRHFEGLDFDQIAERLRLNANTAKSHYYRCLERLRRLLEPVRRKEASG